MNIYKKRKIEELKKQKFGTVELKGIIIKNEIKEK